MALKKWQLHRSQHSSLFQLELLQSSEDLPDAILRSTRRMILPDLVLGRPGAHCPMYDIWDCKRPNAGPHMIHEHLPHYLITSTAVTQCDICIDRLPLHWVVNTARKRTKAHKHLRLLNLDTPRPIISACVRIDRMTL